MPTSPRASSSIPFCDWRKSHDLDQNRRRIRRSRVCARDRIPGRAGEGAERQSARRLRRACPPRAGAAGAAGSGGRSARRAAIRGGSGGHEERDQPHRPPSLRRRAGHRAQRPRRCRAAGPRLAPRPLRRGDRGRPARTGHVRARRGGVEIGLRHLHLDAAGAQGRRGTWRQAAWNTRAPLHLRRGGRRNRRPEMAARRGTDQARCGDRGRILLRHRHRAQRLPASGGDGHGQAGACGHARDRRRRPGGGQRHSRRALCASGRADADPFRQRPASSRRPSTSA